MINKELLYANIEKIRANISPYILKTPLFINKNYFDNFDENNIYFKLEFLQHSGCFKVRGAFNNLLQLNETEKKKGIIAASAGNHALALSYAAKKIGISSKVIMFKSSNKFRIQRVKNYGSELIIADNAQEGFELLDKISKNEGRKIIHPFEGIRTIQGSATLGLEICEKINRLDNLLVSVGGGGLIAGVASIVKQKFPKCNIIGIEPKGACGLTQSLDAGKPLSSVQVNTIADSLGPPLHMPYSFSICKKFIDKMIIVSDLEMQQAMKYMAVKHKFILEPAAVAGIAALLGPLKNKYKNQNTVVILCGANIDSNSWFNLTNNI